MSGSDSTTEVPAKKNPKHYVDNAALLEEVKRAKSLGYVTNELAKMLLLIAENYTRHRYFSRYSFKEDMVSEAMLNLCKNALKFDTEKYSNPFAYYTTAIHNSFRHYSDYEHKERTIKDELLIELGENPSFNYLEAHKDQHRTQDGGDHIAAGVADLREQIEEAKVNRTARLERERAKRIKKGLEVEPLEGTATGESTPDRPNLIEF